MLNYNDLKPGTFMVYEGQPYVVMEFHFLRMQQRKPVVQTKIRNIITGKTLTSLPEGFDRVLLTVPTPIAFKLAPQLLTTHYSLLT